MVDPARELITGIIVVVIGFVSLAFFDALASTQAAQGIGGVQLLKSAGSTLVFAVVIALPGGLLIVGLLSRIPG